VPGDSPAARLKTKDPVVVLMLTSRETKEDLTRAARAAPPCVDLPTKIVGPASARGQVLLGLARGEHQHHHRILGLQPRRGDRLAHSDASRSGMIRSTRMQS